LSLLYEILSILGALQGIANAILNQGKQQAVENRPYEIDTATQETLAILTDATFGNSVLRSTIDTNAALATLQYNDLVVRIGLLQTAALPVILPTVPPAGYGSPGSVDDISAGIWNDSRWFGGAAASTELERAGEYAFNVGNFHPQQVYYCPYFTFFGPWQDPSLDGGALFTPQPLLSNALATDTLLTWLNREAPTYVWTYDPTYTETVQGPTLSGSGLWVCIWTEPEFQADLAARFPKALVVPPVWPGLANVTLGTPVALSTGLTIATPMDGAILELTSVPTVRGFYAFDGLLSYRNIGALTFVDDNSDAEYPQTLGFTEAIYCPKQMSHASAVKIRTVGGIVGTVTPFTINA
jgi:hypothetical protein